MGQQVPRAPNGAVGQRHTGELACLRALPRTALADSRVLPCNFPALQRCSDDYRYRPVRERKECIKMANLVDTIHGLGTFTTFTHALEMSGLALTLREPGAYTVFAPTDAAFARMHEDMLEDLFEVRDDLSRVVKYHVVVGRYKAADLLDVIFLKTMEGQR